MKPGFFILMCFAIVSTFLCLVSGCATVPPPSGEAGIQEPSTMQQQINRQESIRRQQRSVMRF